MSEKLSPKELIAKLSAAGWTQTRIAKALGVCQTTVNLALNKNRSLRYETVDRLRELVETLESFTPA